MTTIKKKRKSPNYSNAVKDWSNKM